MMLARDFGEMSETADVTRFLGVFRKIIPWHLDKVSKQQLYRDLERLALVAPHMLSDIGFARDESASGPNREVWHRDALCVTIESSRQKVIVGNR